MEWKLSDSLVDYLDALAFMEGRVYDIYENNADEMIWLLEHTPLYTSGTTAKAKDLLNESIFPVYKAGRGGQYTYHGPGQRIAYAMIDLRKRSRDVRKYVHSLEEWIIQILKYFGVIGERRDGRIGIWVQCDNTEKKIAAIGVRIRKWITYHGVALNVDPDLSHYNNIIPCGISEYGITSLADLGIKVSMREVDAVMKNAFIL